MVQLRKKVLAETEPVPKLGASSVGVRGMVLPLVASELPECAAASIRTVSVAGVSKYPGEAEGRGWPTCCRFHFHFFVGG